MQSMSRTRTVVLSTALFVAVLLLTATWSPAREPHVAAPAATADAPAPMVGTFTGEFDHGAPVYRLPAIAVVASRSAELAKMAREEHLAAK
jgi:hypothetical protein